MAEISHSIAKLRLDLMRRRENLKEPDIDVSGRTGSATRSIQSFEPLLRGLLNNYLANFQIDYEKLRDGPGNGKPLKKLTFGEVLGCLESINIRLTKACRDNSLGSKLLVGRRLIAPSDMKALNRICDLRKSFHQDNHQLADHLSELLDDIEALLDSPLFLLEGVRA